MRNIYFTPEFEEDISNEESSIIFSKYLISPYLKDINGKYTHTYRKDEIIKSPSQIDNEYMINSNFSPQGGTAYEFESIYDKVNKELKIYLPSIMSDQGIWLENESKAYRIIYFLYSSSLSNSGSSYSSSYYSIGNQASTLAYEDNEGGLYDEAPRIGLNYPTDHLAFIIYDRASRPNASELRLNPLYLSRHRNLININIDIKCELLTNKDTDTNHLEGTGVDGNYSNIFNIDINSSLSDGTYIDKESYKRYYYNNISDNNPYYGGVTINKFGLRSY